jgi:transcription initiation factor TFIIB
MTPVNESEQTRQSDQNNHSNEDKRTTPTGRESETGTNHEHEHEHETCPECDGQLTHDPKHGETACSECGLVVETGEIDHGPDWRAFNSEERDQKARVGAPTTNMMHDKGLTSKIDWRNEDAHGNTLSSRQRQKMQRLRTWDERFRTRDSKERNLKHALGEVSRMASALGLPKATRETASVIYRHALKEDLLPGRSIEGIATAAVYAAARQSGVPRSLNEVAAVSRIEKLTLMRAYRYMVRELGLEIAPADPLDYLPRFASDLNIGEEAEQQAHELLGNAIGDGYASGKNPTALAGAALYAAGLLVNEKVTQGTVSEAADISEVTIRNRYKELLDRKEDITRPP